MAGGKADNGSRAIYGFCEHIGLVATAKWMKSKQCSSIRDSSDEEAIGAEIRTLAVEESDRRVQRIDLEKGWEKDFSIIQTRVGSVRRLGIAIT